MNRLFNCSNKYVIIYSSNHPDSHFQGHVRHRRFSWWIKRNQPNWKLVEFIQNDCVGTSADFYFYALEGAEL